MRNNYSKCVLILSVIGYVITMCLYLLAFLISQDLFGVNNFIISNWLVENGYSALFFAGIALTISGVLLFVGSVLKMLDNKKLSENEKHDV